MPCLLVVDTCVCFLIALYCMCCTFILKTSMFLMHRRCTSVPHTAIGTSIAITLVFAYHVRCWLLFDYTISLRGTNGTKEEYSGGRTAEEFIKFLNSK